MTIPMIETILYVLSGVLAGGSLAAFWTYAAGKRELAVKEKVSETRLKTAEHRALLLKDQLEVAQSDLVLVKDRLDKERQSKVVEMGELRQTLQRSAVIFAGYALSVGIMFGGTVSWICTGARAEARHLQRVIDIQVESRVALAQKQMLEEELARFREGHAELRQTLQEEMEQKAIALAKLEALLSGFSGDKAFKGFISDQIKLVQDLSRYSPEERMPSSSTVPSSLTLSR